MRYLDLHRHLEGSITPFVQRKLRRALATRWMPDTDFFSIWPRIIAFMDNPDTAALVVYHSLEELAAIGVCYAEYQISPAEYASDPVTLITSVRAGMRRAELDFGVRSNLIVNLTRHFPNLIDRDLGVSLSLFEAGEICAIGLAGDEINYPIQLLESALTSLRSHPIPRSFHAGEFSGADEVRSAIRLGATRIGHGIRAIHDLNLVREIADRNIGLEICITSEIVLGNVTSIECHPIAEFLKYGVQVSVNTDDPAVFDTEIDREYAIASNFVDLKVINSCAIDMAFCDSQTKQELRVINS